MTFISHAVQRIQPSATMLVAQRARDLRASGRDVISLSTGEPDFDTPDHIKDAAQRAAAEGKTKYPPVNGIVPLREAIISKLARDNGLDYAIGDILVCSGAKQAISNALVATLNEGDEVIIPAPYWVSYPEMVSLLGGKPVIAHTAAPGFKLQAEDLERCITPRTKWLILNSPCNPTGAVYSDVELRAIGAILQRHPQVHVLSDDIYEHLVYENVHFATLAQAMPALKNRVLVVNGMSKAYAMTGWRIGYAAGDGELIKAMFKAQSQLTSGANVIAQWAAVAALNGPMTQVLAFREVYAQRRDLAWSILSGAPGLQCAKPQGAFYLFADCHKLFGQVSAAGMRITDDVAFCTALLDEQGVAAVPGTAFGLPGYFRISFATETFQLRDACERIARFCGSLR